MNINDVFFTRDQSFAKINLAMNYISRLVRENMTVFDYDAKSSSVSFLTSSDKIVSLVIEDKKDGLIATNIQIDEASDIFSDEKIDNDLNSSLSEFVSSLHQNAYASAESDFGNLLESFESRSKINEARSKLEKRRSRFNNSQDIVESAEYLKIREVTPNIVEFLKENKEDLLKYEDVVNSIKLTNALGKAFNLPRTSLEELVSEGSIRIPFDSKKTVYEMICTQELIRSEITESKENFSRTWMNNPKIASLASCLYSDDDVIEEHLRDAIKNVPYLALASKADIKEVFSSIYEASDVDNISQKDIREYVSKIFEIKKPIKANILQELSTSYGINVQNLKFVPTFANLAKAQSVFFESLGKLSSKDSVVKDVFVEFANMLRKKNGIQTLDVNEFILEVLKDSGINSSDDLFREVNLDELAEIIEEKDLGAKKGDKGKDAKDPKAKDYVDGGDREGDESKTKKGKKDFETKKGKPDFGGNKGDDSKTDPGEKDFDGDVDPSDEDNEKEVDKKTLKGAKKKKKKGSAEEQQKDDDDNMAYDEAVVAEPEEESELAGGLDDGAMGDLMGELESLFKDIDWDSIAQEDEAIEDREVEGSDDEDSLTNRELEDAEFEDQDGAWEADEDSTQAAV